MATWIFQAAKGFNVNGYLLHPDFRKTWRVSPDYLGKEMNAGDYAYIWRAVSAQQGPAGIVAQGRVLFRPYTMIAKYPEFYDDESAAEQALRTEIAVPQRSIRLSPEDGMLLRVDLLSIPELSRLSILRQPSGSTFRVSLREAEILADLWNAAK